MQLVNIYITTDTKVYVPILNVKGDMIIAPGGRTKGAPRQERVKGPLMYLIPALHAQLILKYVFEE